MAVVYPGSAKSVMEFVSWQLLTDCAAFYPAKLGQYKLDPRNVINNEAIKRCSRTRTRTRTRAGLAVFGM